MNKEDVRKCPHCKLVNPPSAQFCDCGYEFTSVALDEHLTPFFDKERRKKGFRRIIIGIGILLLGAILTYASYKTSEALRWSIFVVFSGLFLWGAITIIHGVVMIIGERK